MSVYADTPARAKVTLGGNAASKFPCYWCVLESVRVTGEDNEDVGGNGYNYPAGYVKRTPIKKYHLRRQHVPLTRQESSSKNPCPMVKCGEDRIVMTDDQQRERQEAAATSTLAANKVLGAYGVKGVDVFSKYLPYVSPTNLYLVPTYHCLLYGVTRKFWSQALEGTKVLTRAKKDLIASRAGGIVATDD